MVTVNKSPSLYRRHTSLRRPYRAEPFETTNVRHQLGVTRSHRRIEDKQRTENWLNPKR